MFDVFVIYAMIGSVVAAAIALLYYAWMFVLYIHHCNVIKRKSQKRMR